MKNSKLDPAALKEAQEQIKGQPIEAKKETNPLTVDQARVILNTEQHLYSSMLQGCRVKIDDRVPTAGVRVSGRGQVEMMISPKFWASLEGYEGVGLLMHEMLHVLYEHMTRGKVYVHNIANIAMDIAINQYIPTHWLPKGAMMPEMKYPDFVQVQDPKTGNIVKVPHPNAGKYMWKFEKGRTFEIYYRELLKLQEELEKEMESQSTMDDHDWQENGEDFDSDGNEGKESDKQGKGRSQSGKPKDETGEGKGSESKISEEVKKMAYDSLINKAVNETTSEHPGSIPQHVIQALSDRFKAPKVNWARELKTYVGKKYSQDIESSRNRINRRLGLMAPGHKKTYSPEILIAVDSSGSVRNEWFVAFMSEIKGLLKGQDDKVEVFFFDSEVVPVKLRLSDLKEMPKRPACGGTDFQKALDYANKVKPDLLIVFTDGDAHDPKKPSFPLLWALIGPNDCKHLTAGKKIKIDEKELVEKHKSK
jgi:predicted metal-dependent peptidase